MGSRVISAHSESVGRAFPKTCTNTVLRNAAPPWRAGVDGHYWPKKERAMKRVLFCFRSFYPPLQRLGSSHIYGVYLFIWTSPSTPFRLPHRPSVSTRIASCGPSVLVLTRPRRHAPRPLELPFNHVASCSILHNEAAGTDLQSTKDHDAVHGSAVLYFKSIVSPLHRGAMSRTGKELVPQGPGWLERKKRRGRRGNKSWVDQVEAADDGRRSDGLLSHHCLSYRAPIA